MTRTDIERARVLLYRYGVLSSFDSLLKVATYQGYEYRKKACAWN